MTRQPQIIGNGGELITRSAGTPFQGDPFFGGYPGLEGNPYADFGAGAGLPAPVQGGGASSSSLLGGLNLNQIQGFVERMGGIEGIIGTMSKIQRFMGTFQQMAPMLKVIFNSFGAGKVKSTRSGTTRRRRKRRSTSSFNRTRTSKSTKARVSRRPPRYPFS